jgi:hypothetical protein
MEALAAIGLTGNVLQFIQYAAQLLSTGTEIYRSSTGSSQKNHELENIYEKLSNFTSTLLGQETAGHLSGGRGSPNDPQGTTNHAHISALIDLSRDCKDVCDQLLEMIQKLKVKDGRFRRFRSFRAALEAAWDGNRIAELESRLDRFQKVILFHFFPILRYFRKFIVLLSYCITDQ